MCMLHKRTNILFSNQLWSILLAQSKQEGTSIGGLVRRAVEKTYCASPDVLVKRQEAVAAIKKIRTIQKNINYKELINYGRKY